MSQYNETFFTVVGCMDGRCQEAVAKYGREKFNAEYPDTITEPGIVGILATGPKKVFLNHIKKEIEISLKKHRSKGIIVDGHAECVGDPVDDEAHRKHVREAVRVVKEMVKSEIPVIGVFVHREKTHPRHWEVEEFH